ncbi:MAG: RNA-directed DNA polymerase [Pirellulaceae bacterium]|nr:RNA-directed DNA polymerase [Pirellulaceae bacterium]
MARKRILRKMLKKKAKQPRRSILELKAKEARDFFLTHDSYCNFDLPPYFRFDAILRKISREIVNWTCTKVRRREVRKLDNVNHTILSNKDGRFAWRPLQLCHPILYVDLVHQMTEPASWKIIKERFTDFTELSRIDCMSLPVQSQSKRKDKAELILQWWQKIEQRSIELALDYSTLIHADISDCYGSIYTHSIAWALHEKSVAKENRKPNDLIGNKVDNCIQDMQQGQTNGIPQGTVLMDFVAEIVLGYADTLIDQAIQKTDIDKDKYHILRYRDDYRIFSQSVVDGETILKCIAESLVELGLRLNTQKTEITTDVITGAIKKDKIAWVSLAQKNSGLEEQLIIIRKHGMQFPNSGSLQKALSKYLNRIDKLSKKPCQLLALISLIVDIAFHSPKTQPITMAILSKLLSLLKTQKEKESVVQQVLKKSSSIPNIAYLEIWLQRAILHSGIDQSFMTPLCKLASGDFNEIWNSSWIGKENELLKQMVNATKVIRKRKMKKLPEVIDPSEVQLFNEY